MMGTRFTARVVRGSGKGKQMGTPTMNLDLRDVPADCSNGIYACRVVDGENLLPAVVHYGPRPFHGLEPSFEVHFLKEMIVNDPPALTVEMAEKIRDIRTFDSEAALREQIADDIMKAAAILTIHS